MLVVKIIGFLVAIYLVFLLVVKINDYTRDKYRYDFFNITNFTISAIGYALLYFGYIWYMKALDKHGDVLNGQILIGIGIVLLLGVIYLNVKNTSLSAGVSLSIVQAPIYSVLSIIALFVLLASIAFFSETKPVYNINDD